MPGLERGEFPARGDPKGFSENDNGGRNYPLRNGDGSGGIAGVHNRSFYVTYVPTKYVGLSTKNATPGGTLRWSIDGYLVDDKGVLKYYGMSLRYYGGMGFPQAFSLFFYIAAGIAFIIALLYIFLHHASKKNWHGFQYYREASGIAKQ